MRLEFKVEGIIRKRMTREEFKEMVFDLDVFLGKRKINVKSALLTYDDNNYFYDSMENL